MDTYCSSISLSHNDILHIPKIPDEVLVLILEIGAWNSEDYAALSLTSSSMNILCRKYLFSKVVNCKNFARICRSASLASIQQAFEILNPLLDYSASNMRISEDPFFDSSLQGFCKACCSGKTENARWLHENYFSKIQHSPGFKLAYSNRHFQIALCATYQRFCQEESKNFDQAEKIMDEVGFPRELLDYNYPLYEFAKSGKIELFVHVLAKHSSRIHYVIEHIYRHLSKEDELEMFRAFFFKFSEHLNKKHVESIFRNKSKKIANFLIGELEKESIDLDLRFSNELMYRRACWNNWPELAARIYRLYDEKLLYYNQAQAFRSAVINKHVEMVEWLASFPEVKIEYKNWALKHAYRGKLHELFDILKKMEGVVVKKYMQEN